MTRTKKAGATGRLGVRYGVSVRRRLRQVESQGKVAYECPKCGRRRLERKTVGIWDCSKCGHTFAGGAYTPSTKLGEMARRSARGIQE